MRIEHFFYAMIIFIVVIMTGSNLIVQQGEEFGNDYDVSKLAVLDNSISQEQSKALDTQQKASGELATDEATEDAMFKGGFSSIKDVTTVAGRVGNMTNYAVSETGLFPYWYENAFKAFITVASMAFLIYMVLRFKPQ